MTALVTNIQQTDHQITQSKANDIISAIGDMDKLLIIQSTMNEPKTIFELVTITKIPQTSCYRKVRELLANGLLVIDSYKSRGRNETRLYKALGTKINIEYGKNQIEIRIRPEETTKA